MTHSMWARERGEQVRWALVPGLKGAEARCVCCAALMTVCSNRAVRYLQSALFVMKVGESDEIEGICCTCAQG
jgi:hypothetical protein